ncbi:hypothetical protein C8J56DRAFT_768491 [Mycena floridula]|nr:hypothetical protein C8J56DRAFT_768491 [Mycena floridula]
MLSVNPNLQCGPESPGNATCPLKACCSAFGFCGLTDDFCATTIPLINEQGANPCTSNCFQPTMPSCGGAQNTRSIGYYAGWGNRRIPCPSSDVSPSDIDWSGYTHAHFAFATISQTFAIHDDLLLKELVGLKSIHSMKVIIAVGGWDFS